MNRNAEIWEHMEVVGSDGAYVGTVDRVEERLKLTRLDAADGDHHYIPVDLIERVDQRVCLKIPARDVVAKFL